MEKIDFKKHYKHLYQASAKAVVSLEVPPLNYFMIDGEGDPNASPSYAAAVEALFTLSYTLKFMIKKGELAIDYGVMPLEGLWWADDMASFSVDNKADWKWTMMIMQPEFITPALVTAAIAEVARKKQLSALSNIRFETFTEGMCAQLLHIGPFTEEGPSVAKVHAYIEANGALSGKHHEIYLSDIRRAAPGKWKTIIRQPMTI
jgi:hypothetical protein